MFGNLSSRLLGDATRGQKFLVDFADKLPETWPTPCVRFLQGKLDETALLKAATDTDQQTRAHCYLGLDHLIQKRVPAARTHFEWVRDHGSPLLSEFDVAMAELYRLDHPVN